MSVSSLVESGSQQVQFKPVVPYLRQALIVFVLIFAAAIFGILSRPIGFLATIWPANALLLGMMVRFPAFSSPWGWAGATVGYLVADLITGSTLAATLWLTTANLAGASTGVFLFNMISEDDRRLGRPLSVLYLFVISVLAGSAAGVVGAAANVVLFQSSIQRGFEFWFASELVNGLLLVPVILTLPKRSHYGVEVGLTRQRIISNPFVLLPFLSLIFAIVITFYVGGPGAIAFTAPALLWCALTYDLFRTALLCLLTCGGLLVAATSGVLMLYPVSTDLVQETISLRLGITFLILGPLTAASVNSARNELLKNLNHAASHDFLTDSLARRAFMNQGAILVQQAAQYQLVPAVMMIDIDHFKRVNDQYGHPAGDEVLVNFSRIVLRLIRKGDLFGRLGGEEFAVIMPRTSYENAKLVAERLRSEVETSPIELEDGRVVNLTVSIGLACSGEQLSPTLHSLLASADRSLYHAKSNGRNRVSSIGLED
ncbi:diguanylate cyclase [Planctomicrobium sp. SH527]|uniref:GGDEF domain-containing protein n=1 Tax=Planctomicrobium sp. SH527 TaxID=3448123 RepID=UPI003F5C2BD2